MTSIPTLTTERLTLRPPACCDFDAYAQMLGHPRTHFMGGPYDRAGAWQMFSWLSAHWVMDGFGGWICENRADGAFLGEIAIIWPDHYPEPELGWTLTPEAEGHGYAFEGASAALTWYWANSAAGSVVSYIALDNARSAALAQRLGAALDPDAAFATGDSADDTGVWRHRRPS